MESLLLGIDLGTSSVKIIAVDGRGKILASTKSSYPTLGTERGLAEQDPADWIEAISRAMVAMRRALEGDRVHARVAGIGLSAQMPTLVLVDEKGRVRSNAIVWSDPRAGHIGERLAQLWGKERHYSRTGVTLDGRYIIPMFKWICENDQNVVPRDPRVLSAKDYIHLWLTGRACTDPSTASGFGVYSLVSGNWDYELCREAEINPAILPDISPSPSMTGTLRPEVAQALGLPANIPIIVGAADSVAGVLGTGASEPGQICQIAGSSTAMIAAADSVILHPSRRYLVTPLAIPGLYGLETDILATGSSISWLARILGAAHAGNSSDAENEESASALDPGWLLTHAKNAPPGSDGVMFFPYLAGGEQGALWDPGLTGGVTGLSTRHGIQHIARALVEGICFEARRCLESFAEAGFEPSKPPRLLISGPISRNSFYMQLLADVTSLECVPARSDNASAWGAAILAGIGVGFWTWEEVRPMVTAMEGESYVAEASVHKIYSRLYRDYVSTSVHSRIYSS